MSSAVGCGTGAGSPDADGAGVVAALERGADKIGPDEHGQWEPYRCGAPTCSSMRSPPST